VAKQVRGFRTSTPPPQGLDGQLLAVAQWVQREFDLMAGQLNAPSELRLEVRYEEPDRPRSGMLVYADGTDWNPGSGEGLYRFTIAGAWDFVG